MPEQAKKLTWRDVFNSDHKDWPNEQAVIRAARDAGYKYYSFNHTILSAAHMGSENGLWESVCATRDLE
jgi:hypothetical protein